MLTVNSVFAGILAFPCGETMVNKGIENEAKETIKMQYSDCGSLSMRKTEKGWEWVNE